MEEQLKILKIMSEIKGRTEMNDFAKAVGLTPKQAMEQIEELAKQKIVRKTNAGYAITKKGKAILKAQVTVPENEGFLFYLELGKPAGFTAKSITEFYKVVGQVDVASLDFHLYRGDFENWVISAVNEASLAEELAQMKKEGIRGEPLRQKLTATLKGRYYIENA